MKLAEYIQVYGIQAVLNRPMWAHEIIRCNIARTVYTLKQKSFDKDNWAKWAEQNPDDVNLLGSVEKFIAELENAG